MSGSSVPTHTSTFPLMLPAPFGLRVARRGWKPTTAFTSAPPRASSSTRAPPKQYPTAATRKEAAEKMRGELRYRLELCPCSGESYQHIEVEIVEQPAK